MNAFVLAGGGARGAYEAGVLRFIYQTLPRRSGERVRPDIVCGTSAGAINGVVAVAAVHDPDKAGMLSRIWRDMRVDQVFDVSACDLARIPALTVGAQFGGKPALVDASPFAELVRDWLPWEIARKVLDERKVEALVVAATDVDSGRSVLFVDRPSQAADLVSTHPEQLVVPTRIGPEHCLASGAMPFLFPPVMIDGRLLVDGGLRLNTPLSPALHLGADRLLVVGTHSGPRQNWKHLVAKDLSLGYLLGKAMTALMLDPIEQDLRRLELVNDVLDAGEAAFGATFVGTLGAVSSARSKPAFRKVESLLVRPSEDLGALAGQAWRSGKVVTNPASRLLLASVMATEHPDEADLLSFLLFDKSFTAAVEDLGHRDAAALEAEIAGLFGLGGADHP